MLIAVAIVGLLTGSGRAINHRHIRFKEAASLHFSLAHPFHCGASVPNESDAVEWNKWRAFRDREIAQETYHSQLFNKYERAARFPWLPLTPDPPEPE
jgi:hypothetical protein